MVHGRAKSCLKTYQDAKRPELKSIRRTTAEAKAAMQSKLVLTRRHSPILRTENAAKHA